MNRSTTYFGLTVFIISRLVFFLIRRQSSKVYFEGAKKQACNYAENALCYRCFSRNKVTEQLFYRTFCDACEASGVLTQWCMYELLLPTVVKRLKGVLKIFRNNQMKSEASHQLCSLKKLFRKFLGNSWKII